MSVFDGFQYDEPAGVDEFGLDSDWHKTIPEPSAAFLEEMETASEDLESSINHPTDGVEICVETLVAEKTSEYISIPFRPVDDPHPEVICGLMDALNRLEQSQHQLKEEELGFVDQLATCKKELSEKELAAQENWDKTAKTPVDPSKPWNPGSNDDKRAAINRALFAEAYAEIEEQEAALKEIRTAIRRVAYEIQILSNHWKYYRWYVDFMSLRLH